MKKFLIFLAALSMALMLCGCGAAQSNTDNQAQDDAQTIFFAEENVSLEIYESTPLILQNAEGKTLTWRSSNPERLTVDENGIALAKMVGTVTVYVSDGEKETSCTVTIVNSGYIPLLNIDLPETVQIFKGDTLVLAPYVTYNAVKYTNAEFSYTATGSVSVSETGEITANSVGAGVVSITATWNGVEWETLRMDIQVNVIE